MAAAARARPERSIGFEIGLIVPVSLLIAPPKVRQDALEPSRGRLPSPKQKDFAVFPGQLAERDRQIDAKVAAQGLQRLAHQPTIATRPRRDRTVRERCHLIGHDASGIEVPPWRPTPGTRRRRRAAS